MKLNDELEQLLDEHEVGRVLKKPVGTLRRWRLSDDGPEFIKVGRAVRYRPSALIAWLNNCPKGGQQ
jgi:hypothetical protein